MSPASSAPNAKAKPARTRPSKRRIAVLIIGGVLLCVLVYAGFKYRQWTSKPDYWRANVEMLAQMPLEEKRKRADSFLGMFVTEWTAYGNGLTEQDLVEDPNIQQRLLGDTRTIIIPYEDLNILLEVEMPAILESQGMELPDSIQGIMVTSNGAGQLIVAFEYDGPQVQQVFSLTLEVHATDRGIITSRLVAARGGELALPRDRALQQIARIIGGDREWGEIKLMKLFTGESFGPMDVPIDTGDGGKRNGRITGIEVHDDAIHLTRTTVVRPDPRPNNAPHPAPNPGIEID